jgi:uncharacterized lipoprotein YddW (UPF0748 family)
VRPTRWGHRERGLLAVALLGLALVAGCQQPRPNLGPMRAIWVTRSDYRTPEEVTRIVDDCADAGFNTLFFQVRGNGTAFYKSKLEPWADELGGKDPGFDPLALACQHAHQRKIQLHAWVNVMPAWKGTRPPVDPEQLYNKHPDWFWYDQHGNRQALSSFYVSLNPCLPEVRTYLVDVFREIVSGYDVDGLHLDYIRFPNDPPATPEGSDIDYPYDIRTLDLYRSDMGLTPDQDLAAWNRWRTEQVSRLVADIHDMVRRTKPRAALTAAVGAVPKNALRRFQDGRGWATDGLVDALVLMNYTDRPETFSERLDPWLAENLAIPLVPGLWFGSREKRSVEDVAKSAREQAEIAVKRTGNLCIFAYSSLFDSKGRESVTGGTDERSARQIRRDELVPYVKALAE